MAGTVTDLMNSIAKMEGYGISGSIAQRNNNPGNLRSGVGQVGSEQTVSGTFATFASPADGWAALQNQIELDASRGQTLRDFIYGYAPPSENNTSNYLNVLVSELGVSADSSLSDLGLGVDNVGVVDSSGSVSSFVDNLVNGTTGTIDPMVIGLIVVGLALVMRD